MSNQNKETNSVNNTAEDHSMNDINQEKLENNQISQNKWKQRWVEFKKAYMHAYLNIVSLPLKKTDEKETIVDRLYRYSDFPLLTQVFPYVAFRALEKRYYGQFYFCQVGIHYLLQHFNYLRIPGYKLKTKENQMGIELCESLCLSGLSTAFAMFMNRFPHNKYYYLASMLVLGVPAALGTLWSRRSDIKNGIPLFDSYLQIQGQSKEAAQITAGHISISRFALGITQFTLPLLCIKPIENHFHMYFYSFQKNLFFTELCFLSALFLSSATCALFMPFGTLNKGTYIDNEGKIMSIDPSDSYYFFKGL